MYDITTCTRANVEKMANSQVHSDARSDYIANLVLGGRLDSPTVRPITMALDDWSYGSTLVLRLRFISPTPAHSPIGPMADWSCGPLPLVLQPIGPMAY